MVTGYLRSTKDADRGEPRTWDVHPPLIPAPQDLFRVRDRRGITATCGGWESTPGELVS
jgi:hypothetical protein